jgi:glycerate-2-kinase
MFIKNSKQLIENGSNSTLRKQRSDIIHILEDVLKSINPYQLTSSLISKDGLHLTNHVFYYRNFKNIYLIGFGKASVSMAQAICDKAPVQSGAIITNDSNASVKNKLIRTYHGGHPLPNQESLQGTQEIQKILSTSSPDDLIISLISGGGSSLLCSPLIPLRDLQIMTTLLMNAGATIQELNTIRKHLSTVKGGKLIEKVTSSVVSLVLSDIIHDPLDQIASGPTYPDSSTYEDAFQILHRYNLAEKIPVSVQQIILDGMNERIPETPINKANNFKKAYYEIIGNNTTACQAAVKSSQNLGYHPEIITTDLTGEASIKGPWFITESNKRKKTGKQIFIGGGETTVTVNSGGKGGRNQEMILSSITHLTSENQAFACFATDGLDGSSPSAGAIADNYSLNRANKQDIDITSHLKNNDSYHFFKGLDDIILTGPTGTNVMDLFLYIC